MVDRADLRILLMDDAPEVRARLRGRLEAEGFAPREAGSAHELVDALRAGPADLVFLDIELRRDVSIAEAREAFEAAFPAAQVDHEGVLRDWGLDEGDGVSGKYLLPWIKAVYPDCRVVMVTNMWEGEGDERRLNQWGARLTVLKGGEDAALAPE